jgi:asparagine synthase (glutamine-hydrolysing)
MSAIVGVYLLDGSHVDPDRLKRMNDRLSHRGPDGSGLWCEGLVGLGHQMLWTTPESLHEKLPLEADGLVITADARIDNREELLPELGLREDVSDSEVILETYRKWGRDCVDRLLGDFAFVVWDKAKGELFCARDHMGVKPFYYYHEPGKIFAFATEIKALFAWGVPREINEVMIGDYLVPMLEDREITFYKNVFRLPAANIAVVGRNGLCRELYWSLDPMREIRLNSDEEYEKAFRDVFEKAVKCRLRSAFPVGSMLSGGLDSSSIVCMAREILPKDRRLKTFSAIFDIRKECDERPYIESVLQKGDIDPFFVHADEVGPLYKIDEMLWHEDQPFYGPNLFINWVLYREVHQQDVRILLHGLDGDTTVSHGFAYITELTGKLRFFSVLKEVDGLSKVQHRSVRRMLLKHCIIPFVPTIVRQWWRLLNAVDPMDDIGIINPDFAKRIGLKERRKALQDDFLKPSRTSRADHWRLLSWGLHQHALEVLNIAASAFSIESRFPFYDKRLMELCLAFPGNQKIHRGWTRWVMRRALKSMLPDDIYHRSGKAHLSSNFINSLLAFHRDILENFASNELVYMKPFINASAFLHHYNVYMYYNGMQNDDSDALAVWSAVSLATWIKSEYLKR